MAFTYCLPDEAQVWPEYITQLETYDRMKYVKAMMEDHAENFNTNVNSSSCSSFSSVRCNETPSQGGPGRRHESFSYSENSASQEDFSTFNTPITSFSSSRFADAKSSGMDPLYDNSDNTVPFSLYDCSLDVCSSSDPFWSASDQLSSTPTTMITPPGEQFDHTGETSLNRGLEYAPSSAPGVSSSISPAIFHESNWPLEFVDHPGLQDWTVLDRETTPPQTVIPSVMFQATFASPSYSTPPVTPKKNRSTEHDKLTTLSSPGMFSSPDVEIGYQLAQRVKDEPFSRPVAPRIRVKKEVVPLTSRLEKRPYNCHRRSSAGSRLSKSAAKRRANGIGNYLPGIEKIEKTKHFCRIPGCRQKFKRKEHLKRHEQTAKHENRVGQEEKDSASFLCAFCGKTLSRSDNLKQHKKQTHGQNKPNKRNKYVATCDRTSSWFDDEYEGLIGEGGLPTTDVEEDKQYTAPREEPEESARKQRSMWMKLNPTNVTCSRMKVKFQARL